MPNDKVYKICLNILLKGKHHLNSKTREVCAALLSYTHNHSTIHIRGFEAQDDWNEKKKKKKKFKQQAGIWHIKTESFVQMYE